MSETGNATAPSPLTFGEKAVGLSFNPSGDPIVGDIKKKYAVIIDTLNTQRTIMDNPKNRALDIATTNAVQACMWAVKALTWVD